jgi:ABC-type transport system involved in multi-copper enzyme maturation permease subunit
MAGTATARALPSLGLLVVYTGVFIVAAFVAFARYDIR